MDKRSGKKKKAVKPEIKEVILPNQPAPIAPSKKTNTPSKK